MDEFRSASTLCILEHRALGEVGRMLTWLAENCETFSLKLPSPQVSTGADQPMSLEVGFADPFEADAFRSRFLHDERRLVQ